MAVCGSAEARLGRLSESRFLKALAVSSNHAPTLCTYGFLLEDVLKESAKARVLYQRAVSANPRHVRHSVLSVVPQRADRRSSQRSCNPSTFGHIHTEV